MKKLAFGDVVEACRRDSSLVSKIYGVMLRDRKISRSTVYRWLSPTITRRHGPTMQNGMALLKAAERVLSAKG